MKQLFGTDGMRGRAGEYPLNYKSLYALGSGLVQVLLKQGKINTILIGRDTRESGTWIEKALQHGILDQNGSAVSAGVIPTSAVANLTLRHGYAAGIMISASHNPYQDNGIKIFSSRGMKISDEMEEELESFILSFRSSIKEKETILPSIDSHGEEYIEFLKNLFPPGKLDSPMKIVIDCSNGAASFYAGRIFREIGAQVITIHDQPNGKNINLRCGSLHPELLAQAVIETGSDWGIALDGDADRSLWVDHQGQILNGDHTLYVLAGYMQEHTLLKSDFVVATDMSNMGLEDSIKKMGLNLKRTKVGDKYVLEFMLNSNSNLGGEQSGHTILLDDCPTGDGLLTSLKMLEAMTVKKASLAELTEGYREYPQILRNVRVSRKDDFSEIPEISSLIDSVKTELAESGRINLRYSGTEPLARIMLEGPDQDRINQLAESIADAVLKHLG